MTNRKRFFYNGIMLTLVGLAMRSVGMLFGAMVSRAVGAEGIGLYTLIMTVYSFAVTLATSGIGLTVTRRVAEAIGEGGEEDTGRIMRGAILYALFFGILSASLLFFGAGVIGNVIIHDQRTVASFKILSASLVPAALSAAIAGYFVGIKRVAANAAVQIIGNAAKLLLTMLLLFAYAERGISVAVFAVCAGLTATELISFFVFLLQYLIFRKRGRRGIELASVALGALPLATSLYFRSALLTVEHILIPRKLRERGGNTSESLADYGTLHGMALPTVTFPMAVISSFAGLLVPEFAESYGGNNPRRLEKICTEALVTTLTYAVAISAGLYLFAEEIGYAVYSSYEAGGFISLIAPLVPIMYLDHVTDAMLKGIGEQVYSMWVNIADSALSVALVCILIPKMGIYGYALVIIIMEAFNFLLSYIRLKRRISFKLPKLRAILLPTVSAAAAVYITDSLFVSSGSGAKIGWLLGKLAFTFCMFIAVNATGSAIISLNGKLKLKSGINKQKNA